MATHVNITNSIYNDGPWLDLVVAGAESLTYYVNSLAQPVTSAFGNKLIQ